MNDVETTNNELETFIERFKAAHDNDIAEFAKAEVIPFSSFQSHLLHPLKYYNQYGISTFTSTLYQFSWSFDLGQDEYYYTRKNYNPKLCDFVKKLDLNLYILFSTRSLIISFLSNNPMNYPNILQILSSSPKHIASATKNFISLLTFICCHTHLVHISQPTKEFMELSGEPETSINEYERQNHVTTDDITRFFIVTLYNTYFMPCSSWARALIHISLSSTLIYQTHNSLQHYMPIFVFSDTDKSFDGICAAWTSINRYLLIPPNNKNDSLYWVFKHVYDMNRNQTPFWYIQRFCCSLLCCLLPKSYIKSSFYKIACLSKSVPNTEFSAYINAPYIEKSSTFGMVSNFGCFSFTDDAPKTKYPKLCRYYALISSAQLLKIPFDNCAGITIETFQLVGDNLELYSDKDEDIHSVLLFHLKHKQIKSLLDMIRNTAYDEASIKQTTDEINQLTDMVVFHWLRCNNIFDRSNIRRKIIKYLRWYLMYCLFDKSKHEPILFKLIDDFSNKRYLNDEISKCFSLLQELIDDYTEAKDDRSMTEIIKIFKHIDDEEASNEFLIICAYYRFQIYFKLYTNFDMFEVGGMVERLSLEYIYLINNHIYSKFRDLENFIVRYFETSPLSIFMNDFKRGFNTFFIFETGISNNDILLTCDINRNRFASSTLCHLIQPHDETMTAIQQYYEIVYSFNGRLSNRDYVDWVKMNVQQYMKDDPKVAGGSNGETSNVFALLIICFMFIVVIVSVIVVVNSRLIDWVDAVCRYVKYKL